MKDIGVFIDVDEGHRDLYVSACLIQVYIIPALLKISSMCIRILKHIFQFCASSYFPPLNI